MRTPRSTQANAKPRPSRTWARDELAGLDPVRDHARITHLTGEVRYGDPVVSGALYTVAFIRQMAVPSIAQVVHRGGRSPIITATRKRNDDTMTFFGEFLRGGYDSERGRAAIARVREIHARFPITNDQNLYTLASLTFEAERIPRLLGRELLTPDEIDANRRFWRGVGEGLGITGIPETTEGYWQWTQEYERRHWGYTPGGRAVADAMIDDYASRWTPGPLRGLGRAAVLALCDDGLLATHRLPRPRARVRPLVGLGLGAYLRGRDWLPDPPERSWADHYGQAYGACPHMADVGYRE